MASIPSVMDLMLNSVSVLDTFTILSMALKVASTGPEPSAASDKISPSWDRITTEAVGMPRSPEET
jgi:hypothetical protein